MFRVYSGPSGSEAIRPIEKSKHLFKVFGALDDAIGLAHHLTPDRPLRAADRGRRRHHLDRQYLARELLRRDGEQPEGALTQWQHGDGNTSRSVR